MKLWKILLATMIALVLVCAVAMAEEAPKPCKDGCQPSGWITKSVATCTKGTVEYRYLCTVKGCANFEKIWETIERDDAHHTAVVVTELSKPATCAADGYTYYKCTVPGCGATWTETTKASGKHTWEAKDGKAATCTAEGYSDYMQCSVCKLVEQKVILPKVDHVGQKVDSLSLAPTCTKEGYNFFQCTNGDCGYTWTKVVPVIGHSWIAVEASYPTCSTEGYTAHNLCTVCKATQFKDVLPKVEHAEFYIAELSKAATCVKDGYDFFQCGYGCGYTWTETVKATGYHDWVYVDEKAPTCSAEGYTSHNQCSVCKATEYKNVLPKVAHKKLYVEALSVASTCTKEGYKFYQCEYKCGETWTEATKVAAHNWVEKAAKDPTCVTDGYTAHLECSVCKATQLKSIVPATGKHVMVTISTVPSTCLKEGTEIKKCANDCGYSETKTLKLADHTWVDVAAKEPSCGDDGYSAHKKCSVAKCTATLGKVMIPTDGAHKWEKVSTIEATCLEKGWENWICTKCGKTEKRNEVAKLGHDISVVVENKLPTCTLKGSETRKCVRCDETKTVELPTIAHNFVENRWETIVAPTCLSEGTAQNACTYMCGKTILKSVAALGHKMAKDPVVEKAATCDKDGEAVKFCERCNLRETIVIKALGHKNKDVVVAAADCINIGMKHVDCERCGKRLEKNVIVPALGHKGKVIKEVAPTCTTEGSKTTECTRCKQTVTEKIAKLAHQYSWVTVVKPSAAGNGRNEYKCALCGDIAKTETVKYSKWYYNNTITSFGPMTRDLVGGNDWYRVTPVDLTVDGVYTYDLIASNKYIVGKVTIAVNAGTLTVSYKANGVDVKDEALLIYASKADLATGTAVTAPVGAAINAAETFGADTKVLVSLVLTGDYDAAGKGLVDASAAAGMIANID